jgi:hypothetical protein
LRIRNKWIEGELLRKAAHVFMWVILVVEMLNHAYNKDNPDKQETILMLQ